MKVSLITFKGKPKNYGLVNNFISRSAQPNEDDFIWLKEQGVTDIVNFRTRFLSKITFNEEEVVENLGMKYHNIPTWSRLPKKDDVFYFLNLMDEISLEKGKAHIHCRAGADRTGMYAFIYKMIKGIGTLAENKQEWLDKGHHKLLYPNLMPWAEKFVKNLGKI